MRYSMEELVFMLTKYITTCSFICVREAFKNEFLDSGESPDSTISQLFQKFLNIGSILDHPRARVHTIRTTTNCNHVSNSVDDTPYLSTRRHAQSLNLSQTTIQCLLKELKMYPYCLSLLQKLKPSDYPR